MSGELDPSGSSERRLAAWAPAIALVVLTLVSSIIGVANGFTYDDKYVVELNKVVHSLHAPWRFLTTTYWPPDWGGDGYRPLTLLAFAAEWVAGGGRPWIFHAVNVILYAATSVAVFSLGEMMLPRWAAWLAAACFAVHPVHVEAVANVVGQSELIVALLVLVAVILYFRERRRGPLRLRTATYVIALYAAACLAKEHGIVLPALLAAVELLLVGDPRPVRERFREQRPFVLALVLVAVAFVAARTQVLASTGFTGFQPFMAFQALHIGTRDRILTMFGVVPEWLRLFYWPARLSSEYAPPDVVIAQGFSIDQLPGFALLVAILTLAVLLRRKSPVFSFGVAWICIALLPSSNFILPAGILLAERTLFLPSVGAMFVLAAVVQAVAARRPSRVARIAGVAAASVVIVVAAVRSAARTTVWHDNDRLFRQAVIDAPLAYRAHYMLGAWEFENKRKRAGEAEYHRALSLFPYDPYLSYNMAEKYREVGLCAPALPLYRWTMELDPEFPLGHTQYGWCLLRTGQYPEARVQLMTAMRNGGSLNILRPLLHSADSAMAASRSNVRPVRLAGSPRKLPESVQKAASERPGGAQR